MSVFVVVTWHFTSLPDGYSQLLVVPNSPEKREPIKKGPLGKVYIESDFIPLSEEGPRCPTLELDLLLSICPISSLDLLLSY